MNGTRTGFDPRVHGFAFANRWIFDEVERRDLPNQFATHLIRRGLLGPLGPFLIPLAVRLLRGSLERHLAPGYGLCGGMCFAALDFYRAGLPLPRGAGPDDHPPSGTRLRSYLWQRQLDSLVDDGARFVAWPVRLNYVPRLWPLRGGLAWLLARSREEWRKLRAGLDAGAPVPIGLVRETGNVYDNHQVLAIGYEETDEAHGAAYVYDPNCPDVESVIHLDFGARSLHGRESCGQGPPLRGFFCETYAPQDPAGIVAPQSSYA
jgi:hypothetical protein